MGRRLKAGEKIDVGRCCRIEGGEDDLEAIGINLHRLPGRGSGLGERKLHPHAICAVGPTCRRPCKADIVLKIVICCTIV